MSGKRARRSGQLTQSDTNKPQQPPSRFGRISPEPRSYTCPTAERGSRISNLLFFLFNFGTLPKAAYQYPLPTSKILSTEDINLSINSTHFVLFEMEYTTPHVRCRETLQRQDLHRQWNPRGSLCRRLGPRRSRRSI